MSDVATAQPNAEEAARLQAGIRQCLTEIEQIRHQMERDQIAIEQSQARTRNVLVEIMTQLKAA